MLLTASDGGPNDFHGVHVASDGDVIVVGSSLVDGAAGADQGAVYVYVRPAGGWRGGLVEVAKLLPSDPVAGQGFDSRVAIDGDTIVVGAPGPAVVSPRAGAVYVFVRPAGGWTGTLTQTAKLVASDGLAGDELGVDVAIHGCVILAGASFDDFVGGLNQGSAYVFLRPFGGWSGVVNHSAKLVASDGAAADLFGSRVAIAGGSLVVSAKYADRASAANDARARPDVAHSRRRRAQRRGRRSASQGARRVSSRPRGLSLTGCPRSAHSNRSASIGSGAAAFRAG
jgi:hypothetical protein